MRALGTLILAVLVASFGWAQRICQSPDSLYVDSTGSAKTLHLFVYAPPALLSSPLPFLTKPMMSKSVSHHLSSFLLPMALKR